MFGFFGAAFGTWLVLLAEIQTTFSLSTAALGVALTLGLVASVPVMLLVGRAADRWGAGCVIAAAAGTVALSFVCATLAWNYESLILACLLFYTSTSAFEVGINTAAISFEQSTGHQAMSYFHAGFSGVAALTALAVGGLVGLGIPYETAYILLSLLALMVCFTVWRNMAVIPTIARTPSSAQNTGTVPSASKPVLIVLAVIAALAFMSEGEMGNWAAIYLRSSLEFPAFVGASGFAAFHLAMFAGRLAGARGANLWGRRAMLQLAGSSVAAGMLLTLLSSAVIPVLAGILLVGVALSVVTPTVYSIAGDAAGEHTGAVTSMLTTVGYSGYLFGPVMVGGLAELFSLQLALGTIVIAGIGIALLGAFLTVLVKPIVSPLSLANAVEQQES